MALLTGTNGNDTLCSTAGNDIMTGGGGTDTYIFEQGFGSDVIFEDSSSSTADTIHFGAGILPEDLTFFRDPANLRDLIIQVGSDQIRIDNQFGNTTVDVLPVPQIALITFEDTADVIEVTAVDLNQQGGVGDETLTGSRNNDSLAGGDGNDAIFGGIGEDTLLGEAGDDAINGGNDNDLIDGGDGNDTLDGGPTGDDTLIGGAGNDIMTGGGGTDTYIFEQGFGSDVIFEDSSSSTADTIHFGAGILPEDLTFFRDPANLRDLIIQVGSDQIRIDNQFGNTTVDVLPVPQIALITFEDTADVIEVTAVDLNQQGGVGDETLTGSRNNDSLAGGDGNDAIFGGIGEDALLGEAGDDAINGGNDNDLIDGGDGNDTLDGGPTGDDTLIGGAGNDIMTGGGGTDTYIFEQGFGSDVIFEDSSSSTADTIHFGAGILPEDLTFFRDPANLRDLIIQVGSDQIRIDNQFGNTTVDVLPVPQIALITFEDTADVIEVTAVDLNQQGGVGDETLTGSRNNDSLAGGDGNDAIFGGIGEDTLLGEAGDDAINGGNDNDLIDGGDGNDTLDGGPTGDDTLIGGAGNDIMTGGGGTDTYIFEQGFGSDVIFEDSSSSTADTIHFGAGILPEDLTFFRDPANLRDLIIQVGSDQIRIDNQFGNTTVDVLPVPQIALITFEDTADVIEVTAVDLNQQGGVGDETLTGSRNNDSLAGGDGNDAIFGGIGEDTLLGEAGDDAINGGNDNDLIDGGDGNDTLDGGPTGDDTLIGGAGNDIMTGGGGTDTYIFEQGFGSDVIFEDSSSSTADTIHFGAGILPEDLTFFRDPANLRDLIIQVGSDQIRIDNQFGNTTVDVLPVPQIALITFEDTADVIEVTAVDLNQQGGVGDETLTGSRNNDSLAGGDGNDAIFGGIGEDTLLGEAGDDAINGGNDNDLIDGGDGNDTLDGGPTGDDTLIGGAGNDIMTGGGGTDTYIFEQGFGSDVIFEDNLSSTADTIHFGTGILPEDLTFFRDPANLRDLIIQVGSDQIRIDNQFIGNNPISPAVPQISRITFEDDPMVIPLNVNGKFVWPGTSTDDNIFGTGVKDFLAGGDGNDLIVGDSDIDLLFGGNGDDLIRSGNGNDIADAGSGNDTVFGGNGADTIDGGNDDDLIEGNAGSDTIDGGAGNDTLRGNVGEDLIDGGDGNDLVLGGDDNDILRGGAGDDEVNGFNGNDIVEGGSGNDLLLGGNGNDTLVGGAGEDRLRGEGGDDTLEGSDGNDLMFGASGEDVLFGGEGADTLEGNQQADQLYGEAGNDILRGGDGFDFLSGGAGNDILVSGNGEDILNGGTGSDILRGLAGNDTFVYEDVTDSILGASDVIDGIDGIGSAGGDAIDLSSIDADTTMLGDQAFTFFGVLTTAQGLAAGAGALWLEEFGGQTRVHGNVDGDTTIDLLIRINDGPSVNAADYLSSDFLL